MALRKEESKVEENKTPNDQAREKLQQYLDALEQHIKEHPDKYRSPTSDRLIFATTLSEMIYLYYGKTQLKTTFEKNLAAFLEQEKKNNDLKKDQQKDLSNLLIFPRLHESFTPPIMPIALHAFHDVKRKAIGDATTIKSTTWTGSDLHTKIIAVTAGHDQVSQLLATHVTLTVFSGTLSLTEVLRSPATYANCLRDCLTNSKTFSADWSAKPSVTLDNKTFSVMFTATKEAATEYLLKEGFKGTCCFSTEFSFYLKKDKPSDPGSFIPLIDSVQRMDVISVGGQMAPCAYYLKNDTEANEFVIKKEPRTTPSPMK